MKKSGILHPALSAVIASLGHGDRLVIADAGLPIPSSVQRIDLAFAPGQPRFLEVFDAVVGEVEVQAVTLAKEFLSVTPADFRRALSERLVARLQIEPDNVEYVSHEALKQALTDVRAVVRSGEVTPYANVILTSGVVF